MTLLALTVSCASMEMQAEVSRAAGRVVDDRIRQRARTARLMRRDAPMTKASRELRIA
jgi:hypothetical protein